MRLQSFYSFHHTVDICTTEEELKRIAIFLEGLSNNWTEEAIEEAKKTALELMKIVKEIKEFKIEELKEEMRSIENWLRP